MKTWIPIVVAVIAFVGGLITAYLVAWLQHRETLKKRVEELEKAFRSCQEDNDRLRRRLADRERALRAFRGGTYGDEMNEYPG